MESKLNQLAVLILQEEEAYKDMQAAKKRHAACLKEMLEFESKSNLGNIRYCGNCVYLPDKKRAGKYKCSLTGERKDYCCEGCEKYSELPF